MNIVRHIDIAQGGYLPVYAVGILYLRTLIWMASFWGILQLLAALR